MYEERGYKVTARPKSVVVNPLATKAPVTAATALPHRLEPLVPPSTVIDSAEPPQLIQHPGRRREETSRHRQSLPFRAADWEELVPLSHSCRASLENSAGTLRELNYAHRIFLSAATAPFCVSLDL